MASHNSTNGVFVDPQSEVLVEEKSCVRTFILNRPRQLNALSYQMVSRLLELFIAYEEDQNVKLLILKGKGRAFCAGGDVSMLFRQMAKGHSTFCAKFMRNQYTLDYIIATSYKPQVSILNGVVMGGGAGLSIHGRFRVVTENTVFAMPETEVGLFPDVGSSYFLSRLPGFFGEYLGLTGARLDGGEMLACGLATHFVPFARLTLLEEALNKVNKSDPAIISAIIDEFSEEPPLRERCAYRRLDIIDKCFSRRTVEEILLSLEREDVNCGEIWISKAIRSLKKASPMSLKISLRSIREGRLQGVGQCLIREYRMLCHVIKKEFVKDLYEGYMVLLDKDRNPKWEPSRLELVNDQMVDRYFNKVDDKELEDLVLPVRFKPSDLVMAKL